MTSDPVELLEALIAFPTVAGEPNGELIAYAAELLATAGAEVTVVPSAMRADGLNLHAVIGPPQEPGVLLAAHTDVVAVDGQSWRTDPFRLTRVDDRLYGRGSADMKGFIAAMLAVVPHAAGLDLRRPLHIALSCDEELGCLGVGSLLDRLAVVPCAPSLCIVGEPTGLRPADRHKGKVGWRVDVRGRTGHSSAAPAAVNAVTYAARLITAIDGFGRSLPGATDPSFAVPHATLSIGPIHGGVTTNVVPETCSFEFELRYLPGDGPDVVTSAIGAAIAGLEREMRVSAPESSIELTELTAYPPLAPTSEPITTQFWADQGPPMAVDFGTEGGLYRDRLGLPVVICGPGDMAQAHRADEYLELDQLEGAVRMLRGVVGELSDPVSGQADPNPT